MIVVADTSPVNYLVLIGEIELLPKLYAGFLFQRKFTANSNGRRRQ